MEYSSSMRVKLVIWTVLMALVVAGSSVFAVWDRDLLDVEEINIWAVTKLTPDPLEDAVENQESTIVYLNDRQYIDLQQVRDTWLQWTNHLRVNQLGRGAYSTDWRLNTTAQFWSDYSASIGSISHRRHAADGYYNYNGLVQWFKNRGSELIGSPIVFKNIGGATFSESIGWGYYSCSVADCTDAVIEATRSTWNFFYGERSYNGVHYRALTHKNFGFQGLGLAFSGKKYFLTIHYGTEIIE